MLRATLPARWRPFSAPGAVIIARPPVDGGGYRTNLLLARDRLPGAMSLAEAASMVLHRSGSRSVDLDVLGAVDGAVRTGEVERCARLVRFDLGPGGVEVAQLRALVARPIHDLPETSARGVPSRGGSARDVVVFAATCLFDELDRYGADFVGVLASIRPSLTPSPPR